MRKYIPMDWSEIDREILIKGFDEFGLNLEKIHEIYFQDSIYFISRTKKALLFQLLELKKITKENFDKELNKIQKEHNYWRRIPKEIRDKILLRDDNTCLICGKKEKLEVHHIIQWRNKKEHFPENLMTLCEQCHEKITKSENNKEFYLKYATVLKEKFNLNSKMITCKHGHCTLRIECQEIYEEHYKKFSLYSTEIEILRVLSKHNGLRFTEVKQNSEYLKRYNSEFLYNLRNLENEKLIVSEKNFDNPKNPHTVFFISQLGIYVMERVEKILVERYKLQLEEVIPRIKYILYPMTIAESDLLYEKLKNVHS